MPKEDFSIENWATQARKGLLEFAILKSLTHGERYAYHLVKELAAIEGLGISEGTIYPLLSRLRKTGLVETRLVESDEGPARKYYNLTSYGKRQFDLMDTYLSNLKAGLDSINNEKETRA